METKCDLKVQGCSINCPWRLCNSLLVVHCSAGLKTQVQTTVLLSPTGFHVHHEAYQMTFAAMPCA